MSNLRAHPLVKLVPAALLGVASSVAYGQTAYQQLSNHDHMVELAGEECQVGGSTRIDYYGYMAILLTSPCGLRGIFDPWRDAQPGIFDAETGGTRGWDKVTWMEHKFPDLLKDPRTSMVDFSASTHAHFDHDNIYGVDASSVLDRMVGTWEFADVKITGLADMHVCVTEGMWPWDETARKWWYEPCGPQRPRDQDNVVYYIESGTGDNKVTFVHWGDNGYEMLPKNKEFFEDNPVDVVFIPVDDSGHIVTPEQVPAIVKDLNPKVVIPTHYYIKGIVNPSYTTLTADRWFVDQKHKQLTKSSNFEFSREWLDSLELGEGEFLALYFEDNVAFEIIDVPENWAAEMAKSIEALKKYKENAN